MHIVFCVIVYDFNFLGLGSVLYILFIWIRYGSCVYVRFCFISVSFLVSFWYLAIRGGAVSLERVAVICFLYIFNRFYFVLCIRILAFSEFIG